MRDTIHFCEVGQVLGVGGVYVKVFRSGMNGVVRGTGV
jgi:hypothetical protein